MGFFVLYSAMYIVFTTCPHGLAFTEKIKNHIIDKRQYAINELSEALLPRNGGSEMKIEFELSDVTPLANFSKPHHFNLFNNTFFLMGSRIYDQITEEPTDFQEGYVIPHIEGNILFLRNVEYDDFGVILTSFDSGISHLYALKSIHEPEYVQSIHHTTFLRDAKFLIMENSMYLVTVNGNEVKDSIIIYKWLGNHFDQIESSSIETSMGLSTFNLGNMEIIAVLHNSSSNDQSMVSLFEFDGVNLKRIQLLKTGPSYRIFTYQYHEKIFMVIYGFGENIVYIWDRFAVEFVYHDQFHTSDHIHEELVETINGTQFIVFISNASIQAFSSSDSKLRKLSQVSFQRPYEQIGDASIVAKDRKLYIYGQNEHELELLTFMYKIHVIPIESSTTQEHCLDSLQDKLEQQLGLYWSKKPTDQANSELVKAAYQSKQEKVYKETPRFDYESVPVLEPDYSPFEDTLSNIREKMEIATKRITEMMQAEFNKPNRTINDGVIITGNLEARHLSGDDITFKTINGEDWQPNKWLSYTIPQIITGEITINEINAEAVEIPGLNPIFKVGNVTITKPIHVKNLESRNLSTPSINGIDSDDIYLKSKPAKVMGMKQFNNLNTKTLKSSNGSNFGSVNIGQMTFGSELKVKNLEVDTIDGVNWDEFKTSLFQLKNGTITGSLTLPQATIHKLNAKRINGIEVEDFMTTSSDQHVKSKISFDHIELENATVAEINGMTFNDVVQISDEPIIVYGPVTIQKMNVLNTTYVHPDENNWSYQNGHVIGTDQNDFLQRYNQKVKIAGSLHLKQLYLSDSKIFLNKTEFKLDHETKYWIKNVDQTITQTVKFDKINVTNISAKSLNGIPMENYMLNNNDDKLPTNYHFQNITILGDVRIDDQMEHTPDLVVLSDKVVTTTTCQMASGAKTFTGTITTNEADIIYLNEDDVNLVATTNTDDLPGKAVFDTIVINGNLTAEDIKVKKVNNVSLENFLDGVIKIDSNMNFSNLSIENIYAQKLKITNLNGKNFDDYLKKVDQVNHLTEIRNLDIKENANVDHLENVHKINGVPYELMEKAVASGAIMTGKVTFKDKVHIGNLTVKHMNNINIKDLVTKGLLQRNLKQTIFGRYTFNVVKTPHLVAKQINDHNVETLVDINREDMQLMKGNFTIENSRFLGPIQANLSCDVKDVVKTLESPPTRTWQSMVVFNGTTVLQKDNILSRLVEEAVRSDKNNTITSPVTFTDNAAADIVKTTKDINNINIKEIVDDALLASKDNQVVSGHKIFSNLSTSDAIVDGDARIPIINKIFIQHIHESILRRDLIHNTTIQGHKLFYGGLQARQLKTNSLSGISPEYLVNLDNLTQIPDVFFDTLAIQENLITNSVNSKNFYEFLSDRVLKNSDVVQNVSGKVFFDDIELRGPSKIPRINDISLNDVIFDEGIQNISAPKIFIHNLVISGNVTVDVLNNNNLTERYERSLLVDRSINIKDEMVLEGVTTISGNVTANKINGIPIKDIQLLLKSEQPKNKTEEVDLIINKIEEILTSNFYNMEDMPEEYMYLEKSKSVQVRIPNTISAQVVETSNDIIMHITGEESGSICGLHDNCSCPVQYTLQLTPEPQFFPGKELQRIFSFDTANITIHLITNSVSMSHQCRKDNKTLGNEYVILNWSLKNSNSSKTYMVSNFISGYISGAEFFTWDGQTYMIVCVFYDPVLDSHNSHCKVFKFGNKGTEIEDVQTLQTRGAWSLHLFENPYQGLTLVIGNIYDSEKVMSGTSTDIYYFKPKALQFLHIKKIVGAGALSVANAVVEPEVHLILAQRDSPLLIFNFDVMHRNYYLYQSINFDAPVTSVSTFYIGSKKYRDAYLNVVTENGRFYVYSFKYIEGWKLKSSGAMDGLRSFIPFNFNRKTHLFAPSTDMSTLLTVKKHESN